MQMKKKIQLNISISVPRCVFDWDNANFGDRGADISERDF